MKKIQLDSGLQLEIDEKVISNNMELLDDLADLDSGDAGAISRVVNRMLSKEQKKKLYNHLRVDGVVPVDAVARSISEIFTKFGDKGKNS